MNTFERILDKRLICSVAATSLLNFAGIIVETAMSVAFPSLMKEFGVGTAMVQWIMTGYLLVLAIVIAMSSFLVRRFRIKTLFVTAIALFATGTIMCAVAPSFGILLLGRIISAVGTGISLPLMTNIVLEQAPLEHTGTMMGIGLLVTAIAPAIGPAIGGAMVTYYNWRGIFIILLPIIAIGLILGLVGIRQSHELENISFSYIEWLTLALAFICLIFANSKMSSNGPGNPAVLGLYAACVAFFMLFVRLSAKSRNPMIHIDIFRNKPFTLTVTVVIMQQICCLGYSYLLPNYSQLGLGASAIIGGMILIPGSALGAVMALTGGKLLDKFGNFMPIMLGCLSTATGALILAIPKFNVIVIGLFVGFIVFMFGYGNFMTVSVTNGISKLPSERTADGTAVINTMQQLAGAIGTSIATTIVALSQNNSQLSYADATVNGGHKVFVLMVVLQLTIVILCLAIVSNRKQIIVSMVLRMMIGGGKKVADELDAATKSPREEQERLLQSIISRASDTEFGKEHGFAEIRSIEDYERMVPLCDYDFYKSSIERMVEGESNVLTSDEIVHFNVTSGTMGLPKKIPVTEDHVSLFSKYNAKYLNYVAAEALGKDWTTGKGLSLSEGTYQILPTGVSIGCASSLHTARMARKMPFVKMDSMDMMYTSPKEARQPSTLGVYSRYLHALFALREPDITYGNVTFSSLLLELLRYIELNWEAMCDDIEHGTINGIADMPQSERESVLRKLTPMPERAGELRNIFKYHIDEAFGRLIWPKLSFFMCVGGDGFQTYTDRLLTRYLGNDIHILYLGLSSSEGMYSIPLKLDSPDSVLLPNGVYMEFIPVIKGERDFSEGIKHMWELEQGKQYELVITNLSGLYRYELKDVIEVTGFYNNTPLVQFVNRAGFAINMCAEKTSYKALQYTAEQTCKELGLDMYDYCVQPMHDVEGSRYIFMYELDSYSNKLDKSVVRDITEKYLIEANPDYLEELQAGNLQPTEIKFLQQETFMLYRDVMIMKGCSAAQLKPVHVTNNPFQEKFFHRFEERRII